MDVLCRKTNKVSKACILTHPSNMLQVISFLFFHTGNSRDKEGLL